MTINLKQNLSVPIILYLKNPQSNSYDLTVKHILTKETYSTIIENLSNKLDQYAYFNIVSTNNPNINSRNVIYLPYNGEYYYEISTEYDLVDFGLLINEYENKEKIDYEENNNKIVYEE